MLDVYEQSKKLELELMEWEKEYSEKEQVLEAKGEEFKNKYLFTDLRQASDYQHCPTIEGILGLSYDGSYLDDLEFACSFYKKYAYVRKYIELMESFDDTEKNINILGKNLYEDTLNLNGECRRNDSEKKEHLESFEGYPYSLYTGTPIVYAIAIVALRLESVNFQDIYDLKQECENRAKHIAEVKKQINDYKAEVNSAIADGLSRRIDPAFNTVNNAIKAGIDMGIKFLIKKFVQPNDKNTK